MSNLGKVDEEMRKRAYESALKIEDQRTMQSYHIFKYLPEQDGASQKTPITPYLLLELSNQPVVLTISIGLQNLQQLRNKAPPEEMKQLGMQQDENEEGKNAANEIGATGGS